MPFWPRLSATVTLITLMVGLMIALVPTSPASAADKDCGDFKTQKAAQIFFLNHGGPKRDPHRLDYDGDGVACESNPCPCYYGAKPPGGDRKPARVRQRGKVTHVVDGDTVDVKIKGGRIKRVRVLGIDTPEVYNGVECYGPEASASMEALLPEGTKVRLISDRTQGLKDRYGRILRYVLKGGKDIGQVQIRRGAAKVYVYHRHPFERVKSYRKAQRKAKKADRGLWGACG